MEKSREELEQELAEAIAKVEQYQHQGQRIENRIRYYQQGDRKKRNHRLITRGAAVESIVPAVKSMSGGFGGQPCRSQRTDRSRQRRHENHVCPEERIGELAPLC